MSNIEYIGNNTEKLKKGKIHIKDGNYTGCGSRIDDNPKDWKSTSSPVNCEKTVARINSTKYFVSILL